jgi:hypothetical protein
VLPTRETFELGVKRKALNNLNRRMEAADRFKDTTPFAQNIIDERTDEYVASLLDYYLPKLKPAQEGFAKQTDRAAMAKEAKELRAKVHDGLIDLYDAVKIKDGLAIRKTKDQVDFNVFFIPERFKGEVRCGDVSVKPHAETRAVCISEVDAGVKNAWVKGREFFGSHGEQVNLVFGGIGVLFHRSHQHGFDVVHVGLVMIQKGVRSVSAELLKFSILAVAFVANLLLEREYVIGGELHFSDWDVFDKGGFVFNSACMD